MTYFRNYNFKKQKLEDLGEGIMLRTLPLVDAIDKYGTNLFRSEVEISTNGTKIDTDHNNLLNGAILHNSYIESNIEMPNGEVLPKGIIADIWIPKNARIYRESFFGPPKASDMTLCEMIEKNLITGVSIEGRTNPKNPNKITIPYISICTEELGSEYAGEMEIIYKRNMSNNKIHKRCLCNTIKGDYLTNPEKTGIWVVTEVTETNKTIQNIDNGQEDIFDDTMLEWNSYFIVSKEDVVQYMQTKSEDYTEETANLQKDEMVQIIQRTCTMCNSKSKKTIETLKRVMETLVAPAEAVEEEVTVEIDENVRVAELEAKLVQMQSEFIAKLESIQATIDSQATTIAKLQSKDVTIDEVVTRTMSKKQEEYDLLIARLDAVELSKISSTNLPEEELKFKEIIKFT